MSVYYGPDLSKSVFSIGVFTRDFGFEVWFKGSLCIIWIPKHLVSKERRDVEVMPIAYDMLYDMPDSWFNLLVVEGEVEIYLSEATPILDLTHRSPGSRFNKIYGLLYGKKASESRSWISRKCFVSMIFVL